MSIKLVVRRTCVVICMIAMTAGASYCGANLFSVSYDAQLGKDISKEIDANRAEYPLLNDASVRSYVQQMVNQITRSPAVKYRGTFAYDVKVIHDDQTYNAFCTPGGYIYVYTGLMKYLDDEASLAGVLGHEIAHAEHRHSTERMTKALGYQVLLNFILGEDPGQAEQIAGNLFSGLALLHHSREDESEADASSFKYLQSTKWYPGGAMFFFRKIQADQGRSGGTLERLLSTHPLPQDRVDAFQKMIDNANIGKPTESNLFSKRYKDLVNRIPTSRGSTGG